MWPRYYIVQTPSQSDRPTRRPPGEPLDELTRRLLREHISRLHWRGAVASVGVGPDVLRRALKGERVRLASATQIRTALAAAQIGGTP